MALLFIVFWIACGVLHYGLFVGHFQVKFALIAEEAWWTDRIMAGFAALTGPVALYVTLSLGRPYYWRW